MNILFYFFLLLGVNSLDTKFYYKNIDSNNKIYNCALDDECIIEKINYYNYNNIDICKKKCSDELKCKGLVYYNLTNYNFKCNLLHKLGINDLEGLQNMSDGRVYSTYKKLKAKCEWFCHNHKTKIDNYKIETSWNTRCNWPQNYCRGCDECNNLTDTCENWCVEDKNSWDTKCAWPQKWCSGCDNCYSKQINYTLVNCNKHDLLMCYNNTYNLTRLCHLNETFFNIPKIIRYYCPSQCGLCKTTTLTSTPTSTPSSTQTTTPTSTPTLTPLSTPTSTPTSTLTLTPLSTPTSTPTLTPLSTTLTPITRQTSTLTSTTTITRSTITSTSILTPITIPMFTQTSSTTFTTEDSLSLNLNKTKDSKKLSNYYILLILIVSVLLITTLTTFVLFKKLKKKIKKQNNNNDIRTSYDNPVYERNEINNTGEYLEIQDN